MNFLTNELYFPPVEKADRHGLLAIGGDLSTERLMLAYRSGIFPWFQEGEPVLWWAPSKRMVITPQDFKPSKSLRNILNRNIFRFAFNQNFSEVIKNCQSIEREGQDGTWITDEMIEAYEKLHKSGFAKSVEVWQDDELVGGLYGIDLGHVFAGESMFSKVPNASKAAFKFLIDYLSQNNYKLLDCQLHNPHLESLGCYEIPRKAFMQILKSAENPKSN